VSKNLRIRLDSIGLKVLETRGCCYRGDGAVGADRFSGADFVVKVADCWRKV